MNDLRSTLSKILDIVLCIFSICILIGLLVGLYCTGHRILSIVFTFVTIADFLLELLLPNLDKEKENQ
ncbi:MAG: hypothetical protein IKF52_00555 [Clostridia bacterium]|nr:hypothetical protein [Clostridia bacterium]